MLGDYTSEDGEEKSFVIVNCEVRELAKLLWLIADTSSTCPTNPVTNPNPVYSHLIA
jgi:hypothetical protein